MMDLTWTAEDELLTMDDGDDFDMDVYIHDQDSDWPMEY